MARELISVDISDIPDLLDLAEEVRRTNKPRVLRRADEDIAVIAPIGKKAAVSSPMTKKSKEDIEEAWKAFGGWKGVDLEKFLEDNEESRRRSRRPPVEL